MIPILSPLIQSLGGSGFVLSLTIALFSIGRGISSVFYGWMIDRERASAKRSVSGSAASDQAQTGFGRSSMVLALVVTVGGHTLFLIAAAGRQLWLLMLSRVLTGFGTGVLTIARTVVAESSQPPDRVRFNAWLGIVAYCGGALTPILGGIDVSFGSGPAAITQFSFGSFLLLMCTCVILAPVLYWVYGVQLRRCWKQYRYSSADAGAEEAAEAAGQALAPSEDTGPSDAAPVQAGTVPAAAPAQPTIDSGVDSRSGSEGKRADAVAPDAVAPPPPAIELAESKSVAVTLTPPPAERQPTPEIEVDAAAIRSHRIAAYLLIAMNGLTRGTTGVAETYGAQIYEFAHGPDNDMYSDIGEFFLILGGVGRVSCM